MVFFFTFVDETSSLISSAKDREGLSDPSFSPITSFRKVLESKSRHTAQHECEQRIQLTSSYFFKKHRGVVCHGYNEASSTLSSSCFLSS